LRRNQRIVEERVDTRLAVHCQSVNKVGLMAQAN
jgi:hypothetical protein